MDLGEKEIDTNSVSAWDKDLSLNSSAQPDVGIHQPEFHLPGWFLFIFLLNSF